MTDTTISDALVFPQDEGTGVTDGNEDYTSAGYLASQSRGGSSDGRITGLDHTFKDTDSNGSYDEVDISAGIAQVAQSGVTVQSGAQSTYDTTLPTDTLHTVVLPTTVTLSITEGVSSYGFYLAMPTGSQDSAFIRHGDLSNISAPTEPHFFLGQADTGTKTVVRWDYRGPHHEELHLGNDIASNNNRGSTQSNAPLKINAEPNDRTLAAFENTASANIGTFDFYSDRNTFVGDLTFGVQGGALTFAVNDPGGGTTLRVGAGSGWGVVPDYTQNIVMQSSYVEYPGFNDNAYGLLYSAGGGDSKFLEKTLRGTTQGTEYRAYAQNDNGTTPFEVVWVGNGGGGSQEEYVRVRDALDLPAVSSDPSDPAAGEAKIFLSDGTASGADGDLMAKITDTGGTTKTVTLADFSAN